MEEDRGYGEFSGQRRGFDGHGLGPFYKVTSHGN